jgi:protein-L-isoaspartate(D-aspartate) O-methyltransferase
MATGATLRRRLVRELQQRGLVRDPRVQAAFLAVPREQFVPEHDLEAVYRDEAILTKKTETGLGLSSSSQPAIMAEMLDELRLGPGQRVLEIGAGTGYNAALLQHIVGDEGRVATIDIDPETAARARRALKGTRVKVRTGDGRVGYAAGAPYDRIVVTASADAIPAHWHEQLKPGGLLEVPLRLREAGGLQLIPTFRRENGHLRSVSVICGGFMPIRESPDDLSHYGPMLCVDHLDGGEARKLLVLSAASLGKLSPATARRLVAAACSPPESRPLGMRADAKSLAVYLTLRGPARRLIGAFDGREYRGGLVAANGSGFALLGGWPTTSRMAVYGDSVAADELATFVREWDEAGRPGEADVALSVHFRNGTSSIRTRWNGR